MEIKILVPTPAMQECMADLKAALGKHTSLSGVQMLALVSQLVGNLIAVQDQTQYTSEMAMEVVIQNLKLGNKTALDDLLVNTVGGRQ